jgi:hypothetical protein
MLKSAYAMLLGTILALGWHQVSNAQESTVELNDLKCFMMPQKKVSEKNAVEYKDGKVYFCCGGCVKKFSADTNAFATKANQQLVQTGQYVQSGCPCSGEAVDASQSCEVNGIQVGFCCAQCKEGVEKAEGDEQVAMVFGDEAFAKGFSTAAKDVALVCPVSGQPVSEEHSVEFKNGKIQFCCGDCAKAFNSSNEVHVAMANHQLFASGQYVQKGCPFSGGKVNAEQHCAVGGADIQFCCPNCRGKAESVSDEDRLKLLFNDDAFEKGFQKKE